LAVAVVPEGAVVAERAERLKRARKREPEPSGAISVRT
jgi:hypothetical protein